MELSIKQQIVANLKGRVHGVNSAVAVLGVENFMDGIKQLEQLVNEGIVIVHEYPGPQRGTHFKAYRLRPTYGATPTVAVDNTQHKLV